MAVPADQFVINGPTSRRPRARIAHIPIGTIPPRGAADVWGWCRSRPVAEAGQIAAATLEVRGLDFAEAAKVFAGPTFTFVDLRFDYPEERFVTIGLLDAFNRQSQGGAFRCRRLSGLRTAH